MPFAVHLFFDANVEAVIKSAWKKLADTRMAPYMHQSANRPHFTLAIYQNSRHTSQDIRTVLRRCLPRNISRAIYVIEFVKRISVCFS
jgi:hypothetical protein